LLHIREWKTFAVSSTFPKVKHGEKNAAKSNNVKRLIAALHASGITWMCANPKDVSHSDSSKQGTFPEDVNKIKSFDQIN
jgi:hypothetical protein